MISITCEGCGHDFVADEVLTGLVINCAACGRAVRMGGDARAAGAGSAATAPAVVSAGATSAGVAPGVPAAGVLARHPKGDPTLPAPPSDTAAGWRLAGILLMIAAALGLVLRFFGLVFEPDRPRPGWHTYSAAGAAAVALIAAAGLVKGRRWGKGLALLLVVLIAAALVAAAALIDAAGLPFGTPVPLYAAAAWGLVAWVILLDRPANNRKVAVGFALVLAWELGLLWLGVNAGGPGEG